MFSGKRKASAVFDFKETVCYSMLNSILKWSAFIFCGKNTVFRCCSDLREDKCRDKNNKSGSVV